MNSCARVHKSSIMSVVIERAASCHSGHVMSNAGINTDGVYFRVMGDRINTVTSTADSASPSEEVAFPIEELETCVADQ